MGTIAVGNATYGQVQAIAAQKHALPAAVTLTYGDQKASASLADLGLRSDTARTKASVSATRSWLPIIAVFTKHIVAMPVSFAPDKIATAANRLAPTFHVAPENAKVVLHNTQFSVIDAKSGYDLDAVKLSNSVLAALDHSQMTVTVPVIVRTAAVDKTKADANAKSLQQSLTAAVNYTYGSGSKKPSDADIAAWYKPSGDTYALDDFTIRTYIASAGVQLGVHASNLTTAVAATKQAVTAASNTATAIPLQAYAQTKTYNYCVQSRGVDASELDALKTKLASTYDDLRGWSLDGQVQFKYATDGCDFTVWLSSPGQMSSFGAICDNYWNCEVNNNVVVNDDRWKNTSPAWQSYGGSVEDYRVMLINHETGHMLGFQHLMCPGIGQPAPVMMQESIALDGCTFNIWPTPAEQNMLRARLNF